MAYHMGPVGRSREGAGPENRAAPMAHTFINVLGEYFGIPTPSLD